MKIKKKKPFRIGPMPEALRTAHINKPVKSRGENKRSLLPIAQIDKLGETYEKQREEALAVNKSLDESKDSIKELAERAGKKDGKYVILEGKNYVVGYVLADQEPGVADFSTCIAVLGLKNAENISHVIVDRKKLEDAVNKGLITPAQLKKLLIPQPAQKRVHVKRVK